jgi:hypothetical protein
MLLWLMLVVAAFFASVAVQRQLDAPFARCSFDPIELVSMVKQMVS